MGWLGGNIKLKDVSFSKFVKFSWVLGKIRCKYVVFFMFRTVFHELGGDSKG